ncbi:MAG: enoyl-CoA hydratase-related protein, partial [Planctomycetota bacterium]
MDFKNILFEVTGSVATLTVNRPDKLNALNTATLTEMEQAFEHCKVSESVRALVITGAGEKAFVAGADIKELSMMTPLT